MVKGDDREIQITLYDDEEKTQPHNFIDGETLTLTVRDTIKTTEPPLFAITSTSDTIKISHDDTKNLNPGMYYADIQFTSPLLGHLTIWPVMTNTTIKNIRGKRNFTLSPEVTTLD